MATKDPEVDDNSTIIKKTSNRNVSQDFWQAVNEENVPKVVSLLNLVDINWRNEEALGCTPLQVAVQKNNIIIVALLLGRGADVAVRDDSGKSALSMGLEGNNKDIISLLAEKSVTSLEEAKFVSSPIQDLPNSEKREYRRMKLLYSRFAKLPDQNEIDADSINSHVEKIFFEPSKGSLFQNHFPRKSAITSMLNILHFQTIYNIFVAVFSISLANTLLANLYEHGQPLNFDLLFWTFGRFEHAFLFWILIFLYSHYPYFLQRGIVTGVLSPRVAYILYTFLLIGLHVVVPYWVRKWYDYPPATSAFIICESLRITMKMHSYLMVNKALRIAKLNKDEDPSVKEYPNNVTLWNYFEFLWLPTLIYQTSYPRTVVRRWSFVFKRFGEVALCIVYIYAVWVRYCAPTVQELQGAPDIFLVLAIFKFMMPGIAVSLLGFFMILHSWLNAFAELTNFADRHFYSDWWNATNWAVYYRKWNYIVHHFIHRHVFVEAMIGLKLSKPAAMGFTFLLSAIIHEYVLAMSLGFYKPIVFLMFLVPGVLFIPLTGLFKGSRGWNVFMWAMLIIGHGMLVGLYARAWHLHYSGLESQTWVSYVWIV